MDYYYFKKANKFKAPNLIFFLCGVKYNKIKPYEDKRVVLKNFLQQKNVCSIILEQNFVPGNNNEKLGYKFIGLKNLNDVETLACMIVDGIFIIHESQSTASEISLFASNDSVAKKVFVLIPDRINVGTNYFSGFLSLGYKNLISKIITFYPVTETHLISRNKINIFTYFKENKIGKNLSKNINECISNIDKIQNLDVVKANYKKGRTNYITYYYLSDNLMCILIDVHLLKYYMIAIFNISEFKDELINTTNFIEGLSVCEKWFKMILLNTIQRNENRNVMNLKHQYEILNSINPRLNLRKAISFTLYSFHALGWIKIEPSDNKGISITKKSNTSTGFKSIYTKYANLICKNHPFNLGGISL